MNNEEKLKKYFKGTEGHPFYDFPPEFEMIGEITGNPGGGITWKVIKKYIHVDSGDIYEVIMNREPYCKRKWESIKKIPNEEIKIKKEKNKN